MDLHVGFVVGQRSADHRRSRGRRDRRPRLAGQKRLGNAAVEHRPLDTNLTRALPCSTPEEPSWISTHPSWGGYSWIQLDTVWIQSGYGVVLALKRRPWRQNGPFKACWIQCLAQPGPGPGSAVCREAENPADLPADPKAISWVTYWALSRRSAPSSLGGYSCGSRSPLLLPSLRV